MSLTPKQETELQRIADTFPAIVDQARKDWALFKLADSRGLFAYNDRQKILDWFSKFPKLWEGLRPNWIFTETGLVSPHRVQFAGQVDNFVAELKASPRVTGLSLAFIIIAGILILAAFGTAGVIWAIGYVKEQNNVSNLIAQTAAGKIPPEILRDTIDNATDNGLFNKVEDLIKLGIIAAALGIGWKIYQTVK